MFELTQETKDAVVAFLKDQLVVREGVSDEELEAITHKEWSKVSTSNLEYYVQEEAKNNPPQVNEKEFNDAGFSFVITSTGQSEVELVVSTYTNNQETNNTFEIFNLNQQYNELNLSNVEFDNQIAVNQGDYG